MTSYEFMDHDVTIPYPLRGLCKQNPVKLFGGYFAISLFRESLWRPASTGSPGVASRRESW